MRTVTRDEVLRLLDFAVDRHVFGGVNLVEPRYQDLDKGSGHYERGVDMWRLFVPRYSSDIAAAWQVVERMRDWGYGVNIGADRSTKSDAWAVDFYGPFETDFHYKVVAAPLAVAICRAALLAVCGEGEAWMNC